MSALDLVSTWPVERAAAGYVTDNGHTAATVDLARPFALASVTKLLTAMAVLVAVEEGSVDLDEPAATMPEVSVRHLFAHTSGLPFEGETPIARPGTNRIYSNTGIERLAGHLVERTSISFATYLDEAVLGPLAMTATDIGDRSPASGASASLSDLLRFGRELLVPTLLSAETLAAATSVQYPGIAGIVPGIGRMDPCDWGLGFELKDAKAPHWTGGTNSSATFGHFGGTGTFLWVDPEAGIACVGLCDRPFDTWALEAWPRFADAVLREGRAVRPMSLPAKGC